MDRRTLLTGAAASVAAPALAQTANGAPPAIVRPTYEGLTFASHDKTIRAIHYRPVGDGRRAAIVMMHGSGTNITNRGPWHWLAMQFAADGYEVLTPLFTDAWPDDGLRPPRMMEAWRDVGEHAIDWFIDRGINRQRTAMFGYSLGSYVAVDGALGNSRAAAAIGLAGGTDVYPPRPPRRRIPVLMIRAENDTHVLPRNTAAWVRFLTDHNINVRVAVLADSNHIFSPPKWQEIFDIASAFYADTIGRTDQDTA
jgi:dienelactone hydrolase